MPAAGSDDSHGEIIKRLTMTHVQLYHLRQRQKGEAGELEMFRSEME